MTRNTFINKIEQINLPQNSNHIFSELQQIIADWKNCSTEKIDLNESIHYINLHGGYTRHDLVKLFDKCELHVTGVIHTHGNYETIVYFEPISEVT